MKSEARYVRVGRDIFELHHGTKVFFKRYDSISQARRWSAEQNKLVPGSVIKEEVEQRALVTTAKAKTYGQFVQAERRERRINFVIDRTQNVKPYISQEGNDSTSYLRQRQGKQRRLQSRKGSNFHNT